MVEDTAKKLPAHLRDDLKWKPGQSGNPSGRPKGARSNLTEQFLADMLKAWEDKGAAAIDAMIEDKPGDFVKVVASIIPREATLNINDHSELTDDELAERIRTLAAQLAPFLADGTGTTDGAGEGAGGEAIASRVH